jgi:hypothetical protein
MILTIAEDSPPTNANASNERAGNVTAIRRGGGSR